MKSDEKKPDDKFVEHLYRRDWDKEGKGGKSPLHEFMDSETLNRFRIVKQMEDDYYSRYADRKDYTNMDRVKKKIENLKDRIAERIWKKCYNEMNELNKHLNLKQIKELKQKIISSIY